MIVLQDGNETLELVLDAATATSALTYYATFVDHVGSPVSDTQIGQRNNISNGTTAVTLVDAPSQSPTATKRQIKYISVYNGDSSPAVVTTRINDNGTVRVLARLTLLQGERMEYMADDGFQVRMADGGLRTQATIPYTVTQLKNQIINGNFDIWQRGTSLGADSSGVSRFMADRWFIIAGTSSISGSRQTFTVGQTDVPGNPTYFHRSVVVSTTNASALAAVAQRIEDARTFAGQTATLSFYAKADAAKPMAIEFSQDFGTGGSPSTIVNGIGSTKFNLTTNWQKFSVTITFPSISGKTFGTSNNSFLQMLVWYDAGSSWVARSANMPQQSGTFDIAQVQLETGALATSFDVRPIGVELALCQRYYEKTFNLAVAPANNAQQGMTVSAAVWNSGNTVSALFPFAVAKRAAPAITVYSPTEIPASTGVFAGFDGTNWVATTSNTVQRASEYGVAVSLTLGFARSLSQAVLVTGHVTADAEL